MLQTPNITIIEQQSISKYGMLDGGEDGIIITDGFIAIIDGATSKKIIMQGKTRT